MIKLNPQPITYPVTDTAPGVEPYTRFEWGMEQPFALHWLTKCDKKRAAENMQRFAPEGHRLTEIDGTWYWVKEAT